ncbi:orange carotenoid protein N-terminal domain-containing protein [Nodularia spumigena]|uniref:orange carotenoid protein N-terminal domain-containing protein n=1 Tax=Nodularia spumigena TaxID=70799 RepID=UPI002B1FDB6B|nr:orange carotenoid protein N-terminal domain-containing protein [Nodularia spumigena]MEA5559010.1 orange carotenoid protein N-terminal domain-containing protein [Nodularia spumigena CH309]
MNVTTESNQFSNIFDSNTHLENGVTTTTDLFKSLSVDDQLALLWYVYTEMGRSITPAAPGAARMQFAEGVLNQIKQMSHAQQLDVMRDLAAKRNTQISRSYGIWSVNTKLAFWFELSELMVQGLVAPMPLNYQPSRDVVKVLEAIKQLDFGQQITVLRNTVVNMGVDPFAD